MEDGTHRALLGIYLELWPKSILKLAEIHYFRFEGAPNKMGTKLLLGRIWSLSASAKQKSLW